jgi:hypothetical protein
VPQIETWTRLPLVLREHLAERMRDRNVGLEDLNRLRTWIESKPEVPEGPWWKDFASFQLCGEGKYPKTFLLASQTAKGAEALKKKARVRACTGAKLRLAGQPRRLSLRVHRK